MCEIGEGDVLLDVLPIEHNLPLGCPGMQGFLLSGGTVVLGTSTRPRDVFELIQRHRVTHIHLVPALLIRWIDDPSIGDYDLSSLRVIQSGGQRLQPEVRLRAERALPGCFIQENFGMAEGLIMFVRSTDPPDVRRETCGRPASPDDEVYLVDEEGNVVPDGEPGELIVRGPYTLRGYFRAPEHNARAFTPDGFYRSGDLLRKMPSGNYVVEGRVKDLINRGGEKISAEEVENLILAHPAVLNVACVPYPDPVLGERMCACLVLRRDRCADPRRARHVPAANSRSPSSSCPSGWSSSTRCRCPASARCPRKSWRPGWRVSLSETDRPALLSGDAGVDHLPGALRGGARRVLGQGVGGQDRGRGGRRPGRGRDRGGARRVRHRVGHRRAAVRERLRGGAA